MSENGKQAIKIEAIFFPEGGWRAGFFVQTQAEGPFNLKGSSRAVPGPDGKPTIVTIGLPEDIEAMLSTLADRIQNQVVVESR